MQINTLLIIISTFLLVGCSDEYSAVYQHAGADSKWDKSARLIIKDSQHTLPLFKVVDNKLYLMIKTTKTDGLFSTVITYPSWGRAEMNQLIESNTGIKSLVPADWNDWLPKGYGDECKPGMKKSAPLKENAALKGKE